MAVVASMDGTVTPIDALWWPAMNFGQFRWDHRLGNYEIRIPKSLFVEKLETRYQQCVAELRTDDAAVGEESDSPFRDADYPPLTDLPTYPAAFNEAIRFYMWDDLFEVFLACSPGPGRFMVNSIDTVTTSPNIVVVQGRGYHCGPGVRRSVPEARM